MDINASVIKNERLARSWTQQHLADVCNLSLRTVQRVERFGSAAPDTVMELCAVLEVARETLVVMPPADSARQNRMSPVIVIAGMGLAVLLGVVLGAVMTYMLLQ